MRRVREVVVGAEYETMPVREETRFVEKFGGQTKGWLQVGILLQTE